MLNILTNAPYFKESAVTGICGSANGTFALKTADNKFHLFAADGTFLKSIQATDVRILNDNSCFVYEPPRADSILAVSFLQIQQIWNLYAPDGKLMLQDLSSCEIYANGWYRVVKDDKQYLYDGRHNLIAAGFKSCAVFPKGYALRSNETYYEYADWQVYSPDKTYVKPFRNISAILGDGLFLGYRYASAETSRIQHLGSLYDTESDEALVSGICGYKTFPNGKFILMFEDKVYGRTAKIYAPDGHRLSTGTCEAVFLPDGRFIQLVNKRISALYRPNGLLCTDEVWNYEIAGNYYLLGYEGIETLYNDKGKDLGNGYGLIAYENNLALFENEQACHLFNQNGHVLSLDIPE